MSACYRSVSNFVGPKAPSEDHSGDLALEIFTNNSLLQMVLTTVTPRRTKRGEKCR